MIYKGASDLGRLHAAAGAAAHRAVELRCGGGGGRGGGRSSGGERGRRRCIGQRGSAHGLNVRRTIFVWWLLSLALTELMDDARRTHGMPSPAVV